MDRLLNILSAGDSRKCVFLKKTTALGLSPRSSGERCLLFVIRPRPEPSKIIPQGETFWRHPFGYFWGSDGYRDIKNRITEKFHDPAALVCPRFLIDSQKAG